MDLNGLYSALQPRRIVRLGVRTAGYLAASARLDVHPLPELRSPEDGPGQPDADQRQRRDEARPASSRWDQTSVEQTREPDHALKLRSEVQTTRSSCDQKQRQETSSCRHRAVPSISSRWSRPPHFFLRREEPLLSGHSPPHWSVSLRDSLAVLHWAGPW